MSQAVPFISAFGFHAEYFPSSVYSGVSYTDWLYWLRKKIDLMLDAWGARVVVFDGNVPYAAVAEASGTRPDLSSVWIRRGMWPDSDEDRRRLRTQTYFDMVIEPQDFAEQLDVGPTRALRDTVRLVPPIQLLAPDEIMPRAEACATLRMDPSAINVLVQLGSGNNRDTQSIIGKVTAALGKARNVRIYNLRWPISDMPPPRIPNVIDLAVFPVARFYRAFDFSISAAGYNTAHEVLSHRLPTIFVPNTTEGMDNQAGRADFSAARGLSLSGGPAVLTANLHRMMDDDFRHGVERRLRRLRLGNGAGEAAGWIDQLAGGTA
jgi:UDP:flavonoid glycosyltransferase YjiC (YdhE family)